jgi:hypothetical protein
MMKVWPLINHKSKQTIELAVLRSSKVGVGDTTMYPLNPTDLWQTVCPLISYLIASLLMYRQWDESVNCKIRLIHGIQ